MTRHWTGWQPTSANINQLPELLRAYIHALETRCDPAGELRELVIARDTCRALEAELETLKAAHDQQAQEMAKLIQKHRRHVELSPGVGDDAQRYALAVLDDVLAEAAPTLAGTLQADEAALAQEMARLQLRVTLAERQVERMALCPDHRDKATGRCIVCQAEERTTQEHRERRQEVNSQLATLQADRERLRDVAAKWQMYRKQPVRWFNPEQEYSGRDYDRDNILIDAFMADLATLLRPEGPAPHAQTEGIRDGEA